MNPEASVSDIAIDPRNPAVLYASDRASGVYRSEGIPDVLMAEERLSWQAGP